MKSRYHLTQDSCCQSPASFSIHELQQLDPKQQQESEMSAFEPQPIPDVGCFVERNKWAICCCSCVPIREVQLQIHAQSLSRASTESTCCVNLCGEVMTVVSRSNVVLGKIYKTCSSCCSPAVLLVQNQKEQLTYRVTMKCCQCANIVPRVLSCGVATYYSILNSRDEEVGSIKHTEGPCSKRVFSLRNDYEVNLPSNCKEKDTVLLLNAVMFLNQVRHEWA